MNALRKIDLRVHSSYLVGFVIFLLLLAFSLDSMLLFHTLAEMFSIVVAGAVFILVWSARRADAPGYITLLGVSLLAVGVLDLFHTLTFIEGALGMASSPANSDALWLAARLLQSVSIPLSLLFLNRPLRPIRALLVAALVTLLLLLTILTWSVFPASYNGQTPTPFKIASEAVILGMLLAALVMLARQREHFDPYVFYYLRLFVAMSLAAELAIVLQAVHPQILRSAGLTFKIGAFYAIYRAVIETSFRKPFSLLLRDLARRETELRQSHLQLSGVFEALADGVFVIDQQGTILRTNARAAEIMGLDPTGRPRETLINTLRLETLDGTPVLRDQLPSVRALRGEKVDSEPHRIIVPTGEHLIVQISAFPLLLNDVPSGIVLVWHDVTAVQAAQDRLARQQRQTSEILDSISDSFFAVDQNWRFVYVNQAAARLGSTTPEGLIGKNLWETYPLLRNTPLELIYHTVMKTRRPYSGDQVGFLSGSWYRINVYPWSEGISVYSVDITQAKQLEMDLKASMARERARAEEIEALMDVVPVAVWIAHDPQCSVMSGNQTAYRLDRLEPGSNFSLTPPSGQPAHHIRTFENGRELPPDELPMQRAAALGMELHDLHLRQVFEDGTVTHLYGNVLPLLGENGRPRGAIGAFVDISELVEAQEALDSSQTALFASESRFRVLVESMQDMIFTLDREGRHTGVYGHGLAASGLGLDFFLGRTARQILGPEAAPVHEQANARALAGETVVYEWSVPPEQPEIYYQTRLSPIYDAQGQVTGIVGVGRDITALKLAEAGLAEYAARLEQSNRELEQFAFVASHDLQEPLRKIRAFSDRIKTQAGSRLSDAERDYLERMIRAARRMQSMIEGLLYFSRVTTKGMPFEPVDLAALVSEVLLDLEERIEASGGRVLVDPLPVIQADPLQMRQLFQNLISNGLKFHHPGTPPLVEVRARLEGDTALIEVRDQGVGFEMKDAERIFQPFERLHGRSEFEGTGMGLPICRKIVERHLGTLTAAGAPGEGSTFTIRLPVKH